MLSTQSSINHHFAAVPCSDRASCQRRYLLFPRSSNKPTTLFRSVTLLSGRRCGRIVATKSITEIDEAGLIGLMIGHTLEAAYPTSAVRGVIRCWSWIVLIDVAHERAKMQRKPTIPGDGHVFA